MARCTYLQAGSGRALKRHTRDINFPEQYHAKCVGVLNAPIKFQKTMILTRQTTHQDIERRIFIPVMMDAAFRACPLADAAVPNKPHNTNTSQERIASAPPPRRARDASKDRFPLGRKAVRHGGHMREAFGAVSPGAISTLLIAGRCLRLPPSNTGSRALRYTRSY